MDYGLLANITDKVALLFQNRLSSRQKHRDFFMRELDYCAYLERKKSEYADAGDDSPSEVIAGELRMSYCAMKRKAPRILSSEEHVELSLASSLLFSMALVSLFLCCICIMQILSARDCSLLLPVALLALSFLLTAVTGIAYWMKRIEGDNLGKRKSRTGEIASTRPEIYQSIFKGIFTFRLFLTEFIPALASACVGISIFPIVLSIFACMGVEDVFSAWLFSIMLSFLVAFFSFFAIWCLSGCCFGDRRQELLIDQLYEVDRDDFVLEHEASGMFPSGLNAIWRFMNEMSLDRSISTRRLRRILKKKGMQFVNLKELTDYKVKGFDGSGVCLGGRIDGIDACISIVRFPFKCDESGKPKEIVCVLLFEDFEDLKTYFSKQDGKLETAKRLKSLSSAYSFVVIGFSISGEASSRA